jgi:hypothetical protein
VEEEDRSNTKGRREMKRNNNMREMKRHNNMRRN